MEGATWSGDWNTGEAESGWTGHEGTGGGILRGGCRMPKGRGWGKVDPGESHRVTASLKRQAKEIGIE